MPSSATQDGGCRVWVGGRIDDLDLEVAAVRVAGAADDEAQGCFSILSAPERSAGRISGLQSNRDTIEPQHPLRLWQRPQ